MRLATAIERTHVDAAAEKAREGVVFRDYST